MRKLFQALPSVMLLALSGHALSHHSFAVHFVSDEIVTVDEATVTEFSFTNPHGIVKFTTEEQGETVEWRAETNSPNMLRRRGWSEDLLKPGDVVTIQGWPARDEEHYMRIRSVSFPDGTVLGTQGDRD